MLNRHLARGAYVVAFALILIPMFDAATSVLPFRFGESRWRYGALGLLSNSLLIPMAGVALLFGTASLMDHKRVLRVFGVVAAVSSVACVAAIITFALDALQSQGGIRPEMRTAYVMGSSTAAVKLLLGAVALGLFAAAGLSKHTAGAPKGGGRTDKVLVGALAKPRRSGTVEV